MAIALKNAQYRENDQVILIGMGSAYALADANRGLRDMKRSNIGGTPVLAIA